MLLRCNASLLPHARRQPLQRVKPFTPVTLERTYSRCQVLIARHSNSPFEIIRAAIPDITDAALQQALAEYPDLADLDEEHVVMWLTAATSLLKLTADDVRACCRRHPWLLMSDLVMVKSRVTALSRVLSVEEAQVAHMALSYPDILELEPMNLMEQLVYVSNTTGMSYDTVVQLTLSCPAIALSQPRDVIRAWADVRSVCSRSEVVAATVAAAAAAGGGSGLVEGGEPEADAEVVRVLAARPELLVMSGDQIRQSLLASAPAVRMPSMPPPPSTPMAAASTPAATAAAASSVLTEASDEPAAAPSPLTSPPQTPATAAATPAPAGRAAAAEAMWASSLLRPRSARRRAPRDGAGGGGGNRATNGVHGNSQGGASGDGSSSASDA